MSRRIATALLLLLAAAASACAPIITQGQPTVSQNWITLQAGQSMGQTFVAVDDGLAGIQVYLIPSRPGSGQIQLHLRSDIDAPDLAVSSLSIRQMEGARFYHFALAPQSHSRGERFYMLLEMLGDGQVQIGTGPGYAYLGGALYQNATPQDAQMAFQLVYEPVALLVGVVEQFGSWMVLLVAAGLLFALPGWAILVLARSLRPDLSVLEKLALAFGIGLAFYPVLLLWTALLGLHLGPAYAWLPPLASLAVLVWHYRGWRPRALVLRGHGERHSSSLLPSITALVLILIVFFLRFWSVRSLDAPMWGDSYQHTVMAQLFVDHGGLFNSWEPYAPYDSLTVQFGFPFSVALLSWITGIPIISATLWTGQILNVLAVFAIYPLAIRLSGGNRWAGVGAILVAGLVSPMPAYYVNWGRYAQLAGQAILPVSVWLVWEALQSSTGTARKAVASAILLTGMVLTYYRMPFYFGTLLIALLVGWGLPHWGTQRGLWVRASAVLALIAIVASVLFLPWVPNLLGGSLAGEVGAGISTASTFDTVLADYRVWKDIDSYVPLWLVLLSVLGLAAALVKRQWAVAAMGLWVITLAGIVAGRLIRLPGASMMQSFAVLIALYLPVSLVVGWGTAQLAGTADASRSAVARFALVGVLFALAVGGAWSQRSIAQPQSFALVTRPDVEAMAWVREHTPVSARFLTEGFRIYDGEFAVGADAGWWLPLFTGRANTIPPQYAMVNERSQQAGYSKQMVDLIAHLEKTSPASPEGTHLLCELGITHVYIGQGHGQVGAGATQLFSPDQLVASSAFQVAYRRDRVYIFELGPLACGANP